MELLSEYSVDELNQFLELEKSREDEAYQIFCHCAASRAGLYVKLFSEACKNQNLINEELRKRKAELNEQNRNRNPGR